MHLPTLAEITPTDRNRVGGKAFHLARLVREGLPVPDGFVIPIETFAGWLADAGLLARAEAIAQRPGADGAHDLQEQILALPLPDELERGFVEAAVALGGRVAVRSSAVDEDGRRRSFAGQHLTLLNIEPGRVGQAVRECWASLYSPAALAYRAVTGRGPVAGGMAVLVQRQLDPAVSGVLFTINPLNGSWREMVVEATWGLGEALVSGAITPHWYLVRRPRRAPRPVQRVLSRVRLHLVQQDLPEIPERWSLGPEGDVVRDPLPGALVGRATLDRDAVFRLCRLGLRVESLLGEPQDVEWAIDAHGAVQLLQARPITTAGSPRTREDVLWTRRFVGERWPEPATPLGWSLLAPVFEHFIAYPETQVRHLGGGPALKLVSSRPYINATVFRHLAFKLPGAPAPRFMLELVPPEEEADWQRRFAVLPHFAVYGSILKETFRERRWRRFRWNPLTNHKAWEQFRQRLERELPALQRIPVSDADAVRLVGAQMELVRAYVGVHVTSLLFANLFYQLLESALAVWAPEDAARLMEGLAVCPPGNLTLETNEALWKLAREATDGDLVALEDGREPSAPFRRLLDGFLERYGHRSTASWEIFSPRWNQRPALLVPLLRAHKRSGSEEPAVRARKQQDAYEAARRELAEVELGPLQRRTLDRLVYYTREYLLLRENQRFWFDRLLWAVQRTLLHLGGRLVARGVLSEADDVAFLTWDELRGVAEGTLPAEPVKEWVGRRRAQREIDAEETPPVFLRGDEGVLDSNTGARMQGLGISPGRVRGRARILRSPSEGHRLAPGEILVTHAVDPGWTPLFLNAGGIVLEMGSRLSHGAVVAREYRIPAVVNLEGVTRRLKDGQEVTVDGTRGIVWVHP